MLRRTRMRFAWIPGGGLWLLLLVLVIALLGIVATKTMVNTSSTSSPPKPTYQSACEKTAMSQISMDNCLASEVKQLKNEMQVQLHNESIQFGHVAVARAQNAWVHFEQAECQLEDSGYKGGSIQPLIYETCERGLLVQRITELDAITRKTPR